ncbi:PAS domain-containing sensor histidine kinase [Mucilaginibacter lappiensis]|uniref:histidine kinase n=1 Tax=Mucilaginibacter lappiensis TaxID=354630 RepID=A0A841JIG7_9SPHI|nr:ATP-binding protein [Mucilaginibacter lappiensis]MBB6130949.1 PAS domain S-box-containing protein [Mucilaginibacter lappiensis]
MDPHIKQLQLLKLVEEIEGHAIFVLDKNGNIETWNKSAEKIKGYKAEEIIGQNISTFYTNADLMIGLPEKLLAEATVNGTAYNESWRVRKDKTKFWGAVTITALHDDEGNVTGFAKITRDLTERMAAENIIRQHSRELEIKNKEIEQFAYIASHDLQEPLFTVTNLVEFFQTEYQHLFDENANTYLNFIIQATGRMKNLIKNLLDYSHIGSEKKLAKIDCNQLLDTLTTDLANQIKKSGAKISYKNLPVIKGYPTELSQLFQNLISNAIKFRNKNELPKIEVSAIKGPECWRFKIKDNGIGIDPRFKVKIFLIFQRLHDRNEYEGNGIGLAYCKKIVELHGGRISVESNNGKGSSFVFTIPFEPNLLII